MSDQPAKSGGTGIIIAVIVVAVLAIPCVLGVGALALGGLLVWKSSPSIPPPPVPTMIQPPQTMESAPRATDAVEVAPALEAESHEPAEPKPAE